MQRRLTSLTIWKAYDIELDNELYSLWGNIHPSANVFSAEYRGRQYLAICIIAGAMVTLYPLEEWNSELLNFIVIHGDRYFTEKMKPILEPEYEVQIEDFIGHIDLDKFHVGIKMERLVFGTLYASRKDEFNLSRAIQYFFKSKSRSFGILQCFGKCLAFGQSKKTGHYFMFDCQSKGSPLYWPNQGGVYVLMCKGLTRLLHCMIMTLQLPWYNIDFGIHYINYDVEAVKHDELFMNVEELDNE